MEKYRRGLRLAACLLALATCAVLLCSCLHPGKADSYTAAMPVIVVGSDNYPPFNYMGTDGAPTGIDVELATEAFGRLGYRVKFVTIDWEKKKELVENDTIDCIWGCFSMDGREQLYRWVGPYMVSRQVVAVNADSSIETLADLAGKTMMVQSTTKPEEIFLGGTDPRIPQFGELLSAEDRSVQYAMLNCGYVDAIAAHEAAILRYMQDCNANFRILEEPLLVTGIGVAFALNDTRGLDEKLTETFAAMRADGTMKQIVGKYLPDPEKYLEVDALEP